MTFKKVLFLILMAIAIAAPNFVLADKWGIDAAAPNSLIGRTTGNNPNAIPDLIGQIIGIALSFVGAIFFLLVLYAGFRWMTAFGNEEKVSTSKSIMEHAVLGLVIVLSAYAISRFVFGALTDRTAQNNPGPQNIGGICSDSLDPVECNTRHDDVNTGAPLCKWVGDPATGSCQDNI